MSDVRGFAADEGIHQLDVCEQSNMVLFTRVAAHTQEIVVGGVLIESWGIISQIGEIERGETEGGFDLIADLIQV